MNKTHNSPAHDVLIDAFECHCSDIDCGWYGNHGDCELGRAWERLDVDSYVETDEDVHICPRCGGDTTDHKPHDLDHNDIRLVTTEIANIVGWIDAKGDNDARFEIGFRMLSARVFKTGDDWDASEEGLVAGSYDSLSLRPESFDATRVRDLVWALELLS